VLDDRDDSLRPERVDAQHRAQVPDQFSTSMDVARVVDQFPIMRLIASSRQLAINIIRLLLLTVARQCNSRFKYSSTSSRRRPSR
jgi:hypothetical protein